MRTKLWTVTCLLGCTLLTSCGGDDWDPTGGGKNQTDTPKDDTNQNEDEKEDDGYHQTATMTPGAILIGKDWKVIDSFMQSAGWNYTEHPSNFSTDHVAGVHIEVVKDAELDKSVFKLNAHANKDALDYERGDITKDRQRNEMKTNAEQTQWNKMNGNRGEWQKLEWKFKLPADFRPTTDFCHIHQLKMAEAASRTKFPIITFTPRCDAGNKNERLQIIHYGNDDKQNILVNDEVPLSEIKGKWIQVQCKVYYDTKGSYSVKLTRISDGKVLLNKTFEVDMWRDGGVNVRSKFGIYRSFGRKMADYSDRPTNGIKDESIYLTDFVIYEK